jgi:hypothetical protein
MNRNEIRERKLLILFDFYMEWMFCPDRFPFLCPFYHSEFEGYSCSGVCGSLFESGWNTPCHAVGDSNYMRLVEGLLVKEGYIDVSD